MKCVNCKQNIVKKDEACYSKQINEYFCGLTCLTNYAHEYFRCIPINKLSEQIVKGDEENANNSYSP